RNNISVFDLNTFELIKHDQLPTNSNICYHCFVSKSENEQVQEMMKTNKKYKQNYQMLLFYREIGLSIEYDEDNNTFQFHQLPVYHDIVSLFRYAYVCIDDIILFFGGLNIYNNTVSRSVHKYSIREDKWMTFQNTLPSPSFDCVAILSEEDSHIYVIGGRDNEKTAIKTNVRIWDPSYLSKKEIKFVIKYWIQTLKIKLVWIDDFDKIIIKYCR
ncbi:hypothetical protein RFI_38651, partial [Reticulomyxa filosa]